MKIICSLLSCYRPKLIIPDSITIYRIIMQIRIENSEKKKIVEESSQVREI